MNYISSIGSLGLLSALILLAGCAGGKEEAKKDKFFTSGSKEADQRASQRMAQDAQIASSTSGEKTDRKKVAHSETGGAVTAEVKQTLFERLGGEQGIAKIVDDLTPRVIQDPRVNWERKGVKRGGFSLLRDKEVPPWQPTSQNIAILKKHMAQFLALATGGPAKYQGKEMRAAHAEMRITNAEFDAVIGDLKATLDRLQIANQEQKELLAVVESTRPQIVTER